MSLPKPWSLSVRRLVTSWPWPTLAPPAFAGQSAEAASKGQKGAAPKNAGCRARPGLGAQGHPRASPLTPPPHSGRRGPCSARQEVLPAASDWPPLSSPRAPATRTRRPPGQRGGACPGFPRPPARGRRESVPSCVPLPCLKRSAAQEAIVTPSCPVRDHSPPQPGEGERPAACFSRLPSGAQPGSMAAEGWAGGRCYSQQVPGCLLPGTNLRTAPGTRGPLQVRTWLRHAACLPPPPEESRPEGTRPVLSTDTQSVLSLHDFRRACAQSISWAGDGDERPVERHVQGAAGAPALLAMNPPPTPPLTATGNRK